MRSTDDEVSRKAGAASELSCDCFSGWAQGRAVAEGRWVDTGIGRWAHRATMAELGYTVDEVEAGFRFPTEDPAAIYVYGSSATQVQWYDIVYMAGLADAAPLSACSGDLAAFFGDTIPPRS